ncbi:hypothetical protein FRB99_006971 [Tulasnella sp. 403]|nr:hypothetical protein FRB99_006971 [Tulasnella sp. 403]
MAEQAPNPPQRFCQVIELKKEYEDEYKKIHRETWPSVLQALRRAHVADYSINILPVPIYPSKDPEVAGLLVATFKYTGSDFAQDMRILAQDPETQRWWKLTDPMQNSLIKGAKGSATGEWWHGIEEIFRFEG